MFYNEDTLSSKERKNLPDSVYGLPEEKKYPLTDASHVRSAISYFRYCVEEKRSKLAKNIISAANKYGIDIDPESEIYKYIHKSNKKIYKESSMDTSFDGINLSIIQEAKKKKPELVIKDDKNEKAPSDTIDDNEDYTKVNTDNSGDTDFTSIGNDDETPAETPAPNNADADQDFTAMQDIDSPDENNTDINNNVSNTPEDNSNVRPDENNGSEGGDTGSAADNAGENGEEDQDFTDMDSDTGDEPDGNTSGSDDDNSDNDLGSSDTNDTDTSTGGSGMSSEINSSQSNAFSNLTEEQLKIKTNHIKQSFVDLYNSVVDTLERLTVINKNSDSIETINFVIHSLSDLKEMLSDSLTDTFGTKSLVENQIILQKFIVIYKMNVLIIEKLISKVDSTTKK